MKISKIMSCFLSIALMATSLSCYSVSAISSDVDSFTITSNTTNIETISVSNELYFNSQYDYIPVEIGLNSGISLAGYDDDKYYEIGDSPIEFTIDDEQIAKVSVVQGMSVNILGVSVGETVLNARTPDGRTASIKVVVKEAPSTSTTAVWNDATTTTTTTAANELYFNSQYGYVPVEIGLNSGISIAGYDDDKFYEIGESPIEFTIDDEQIAKISVVQGISVNVLGVSAGQTMLNAKAPDGRTASIKVVVRGASSTSTIAVWDITTTTTTTVAEVDSPLISVEDILSLAQKGDALSWGDFEQYEHTNVGSGLIVWEFNIKDDSSKLLIGGGSLDENPVYIRLQMSNGTTLDVRNDDLTSLYYDDGLFMMGDVNADGDFTISDVVLLQKWLLAVPDTNLANWKAADFCKDNKLDVFDLCLMKRALIEQRISEGQPVLYCEGEKIGESDEKGWYSTEYSNVITDKQLKDNPDILSRLDKVNAKADELKSTQMIDWKWGVEDYGEDYLYLPYVDENGNADRILLCKFGWDCAWLDDADVQMLVSMLIGNGYYADKTLFEYYIEDQ